MSVKVWHVVCVSVCVLSKTCYGHLASEFVLVVYFFNVIVTEIVVGVCFFSSDSDEDDEVSARLKGLR